MCWSDTCWEPWTCPELQTDSLFWTNSKVLLKSTEGLFQPALIHLKWIFSITLHKKIMQNFADLHSRSPKTVKTKEHLHVLLKITSPWTEATCSALCGSPGRRQTVKWKWLLTFEHQQSHWEPFSCSPRLLWIYLQHSKRFQRSHPPSAPGGQVWAVLTGGLRERGWEQSSNVWNKQTFYTFIQFLYLQVREVVLHREV